MIGDQQDAFPSAMWAAAAAAATAADAQHEMKVHITAWQTLAERHWSKV